MQGIAFSVRQEHGAMEVNNVVFRHRQRLCLSRVFHGRPRSQHGDVPLAKGACADDAPETRPGHLAIPQNTQKR